MPTPIELNGIMDITGANHPIDLTGVNDITGKPHAIELSIRAQAEHRVPAIYKGYIGL
jgi:hypothetical protein